MIEFASYMWLSGCSFTWIVETSMFDRGLVFSLSDLYSTLMQMVPQILHIAIPALRFPLVYFTKESQLLPLWYLDSCFMSDWPSGCFKFRSEVDNVVFACR